jgi:cob(I)alamin adenosyltransferase
MSQAALTASAAASAKQERGYIHIYTGNGKGKTTAAFGLALRAAGHGKRVFIGQFMKGQPSGEITALAGNPLIQVEQFGGPGFVRQSSITERQSDDAHGGLARASEVLLSGEYDLVVFDEIDVAIAFRLLSEHDCLALIDARPMNVELVLTGRRASPALIERADLVTEMRDVKHYYNQGTLARAGIEY